MGDLEGAWSVKETWGETGFWSKLDALTILLIRMYWIIFIVMIIVAIISGIFFGGIVTGKESS